MKWMLAKGLALLGKRHRLSDVPVKRIKVGPCEPGHRHYNSLRRSRIAAMTGPVRTLYACFYVCVYVRADSSPRQSTEEGPKLKGPSLGPIPRRDPTGAEGIASPDNPPERRKVPTQRRPNAAHMNASLTTDIWAIPAVGPRSRLLPGTNFEETMKTPRH